MKSPHQSVRKNTILIVKMNLTIVVDLFKSESNDKQRLGNAGIRFRAHTGKITHLWFYNEHYFRSVTSLVVEEEGTLHYFCRRQCSHPILVIQRMATKQH